MSVSPARGNSLPIYSYQCTSCDHQFDLKQSFDASPTQNCPVCQNQSRRLFHPVGVIYKGSGFYTTDYRKPDSAAETKARASKASTSEASDTSSTQSSDTQNANKPSDGTSSSIDKTSSGSNPKKPSAE
tara:strand:+ start:73 stop:459 length:387 start_codon:yes stop_codon:yes gene_type:complete